MKSNIINTSIMPTKANIEKVAQSILQPIQDGYMSVPEAAVRIKSQRTFLEKVKSELEIKRKRCCFLGAKIEIVEAGVKYAYQDCEKWQEIKNKLLSSGGRIKKIEEQIKIANRIGKSLVDENTGEVIFLCKRFSTLHIK